MTDRIAFYCPTCSARLRASVAFSGKSCPCPKCQERVIVPPRVIDEDRPLLILDDGLQRTRPKNSLRL